MPRRKQKNNEKQIPPPQRFKWKQKTRYKTYEKADTKRRSLIEEGEKHVKIRRCGPDGTQFKVVVGTPVETKDKKSKKTKTSKQKEEKANDTAK